MSTYSTPGRPIVADPARMSIERFPVTILASVQFLAMIVIPAALKGTEPFGLIAGICATMVGVAFYVELMMQPLAMPRSNPKAVAPKASVTVWVIGMAATVITTLGGRGSYAVQIGLVEQSPLTSAMAPFTNWLIFGVALLLWGFRRGDVTRSAASWAVLITCLISLWEGLTRAILGQSIAFIVTVLILAVLARLVRVRVIFVALLLIPLLWPPIYELRDSLRRATAGAMTMVSANDPLGRLQSDEQMAYVERLTPLPLGLEPPSMVDLLRIGLIPGFLDSPDRPALDTGSRISVALGGQATNSQSATMLGNIYIFEGWVGVAVFGGLLALVLGMAIRRDNPWSFALVGVVYWSALSFNATYPDVIPRIAQMLLSMAAAYVVVRLVTKSSTKRNRARGRRRRTVPSARARHGNRASR